MSTPQFVLVNQVVLATGALYPGTTVGADQQAAVQQAGGILASTANPAIEFAALYCQQLRASGHFTPEQLSQVMQGAFTASTSLTGPTANRPTGLADGVMWFDTTLGLPVWSKATSGTGWVNATGAPA
jgi:K+-transporting ATPase c subunit